MTAEFKRDPGCESGCAATSDGLAPCQVMCTVTRQLETAAVDEIDALANPTRPALCFVSAHLVAEHAAQKGLDEVANGRRHNALFAVTRAADTLAPSPSDATSPNGLARQGARDGIVGAWSPMSVRAPATSDMRDVELYSCAYSLTSTVVKRLIDAAKGGR